MVIKIIYKNPTTAHFVSNERQYSLIKDISAPKVPEGISVIHAGSLDCKGLMLKPIIVKEEHDYFLHYKTVAR